jgi:subtilisin family serine protease
VIQMATAGRRLLVILCLILALTTQGSAQFDLGSIPPIVQIPGSIPPILPNHGSIPIIVQISPLANIDVIAAVLRGTVVDSIPGAFTYLLNVPMAPPILIPLLRLLGVQWVEVNTAVLIPDIALLNSVTIPGTVAADWYKDQPAMQLTESQTAHTYSTGTGVVVADINTQVDYSHPALVGHLTSGYDFIASRPSGSTSINQSEAGFIDQSEAGFIDQSEAGFIDSIGGVLGLPDLTQNPAYGHGTLCAGIIAVVAPGSMIMPLRAFDTNGQSDLFTLAKAIRYAVANGAQVINMSFGTPNSSKALQSAIQYAQSNNVILVASAGNDNTSTPQYPAGYSGVLGVAATDLHDQKASFSNYGNDIFVDAPGVNIISAYPGGTYSIASGTSFSAPAVAGTAALVRSLTWTGAANAIAAGAVNIDFQNPSYATQLGYGRIDVLHSVKPN